MADEGERGFRTESLSGGTPDEHAGPAPLPLDAGAYRVESLLGEGASGQVWKAFDTRLKRTVALKVLKGEDPLNRERFLREARAQASLDHEHICKIYEVGRLGDHPFIAMQFVSGGTLHAARAGMTETQKVEVLRQVALAIHHAHDRGLIHRDLKPSNILMERADDGSLRPFVTDFGLARDRESAGLTSVGSVVGTPWYMAPEQARGEALDQRCDIYSLGATLYDLLCGHPPFQGGAVEVLTQIATREVPPLKSALPSVSRDLETIVMKCVAPERQRRYSSALALAQDLRCYLEGDPLAARPEGIASRLVRRVRKHKVVSAVSAGSVAVALAFAAVGLVTWWRAGQREDLARRLGQEVERNDWTMRTAYLLPLHDTTPERNRVREARRRIAEVVASGGRAARGPGLYALGRSDLVLRDFASARKELEGALAAGYGPPEVSFALGRVLGELYQKGMQDAARQGGRKHREKVKAALDAELRLPALRALQDAQGGGGDSPAYARALIAYYGERYEVAGRQAAEALTESPLMYEALQLQGDIDLAQGRELQTKGDYPGAVERFASAGRRYDAAAEVGRSDPSVYEGDAFAHLQAVEGHLRQGNSGEEDFRAGLEATANAERSDPRNPSYHDLEAGLYWRWAEHLADTGQDSAPAIEAGLAAARKALALAPEDAAGHGWVGILLWTRADREAERGQDPRASLRGAVEEHLIWDRLAPHNYATLSNLGGIYFGLANEDQARSGDPEPNLNLAIATFRRAVPLEPDNAVAFNNMGGAFTVLSEWRMGKGLDATAALAEAEAAYEQALALNPNDVYAHNNLGETLRLRAQVARGAKEDPLPYLDRAESSFTKALAINPKFHYACNNLGLIWELRADLETEGGRDPRPDLSQALSWYHRALALKPTYANAKKNDASAKAKLAKAKGGKA